MYDNPIQNNIMQAAIKVFVSKGKNGARMQEIADLAGVNKMLLHYYFKNKDFLYKEVIRNVLIDLYRFVIETSCSQATFKETLKVFIDRHFEFLLKRRDILLFLIWEINHEGKDIKKLALSTFNTLGSNPLIELTKKITEASEKGEIREINPLDFIINIASLNIISCILLPMFQTLDFLDSQNTSALIEHRKHEIFRLIWNDIALNAESEN